MRNAIKGEIVQIKDQKLFVGDEEVSIAPQTPVALEKADGVTGCWRMTLAQDFSRRGMGVKPTDDAAPEFTVMTGFGIMVDCLELNIKQVVIV